MNVLILFAFLFDDGIKMVEHILNLLVIFILVGVSIEVLAERENDNFELFEVGEHRKKLVALLIELRFVHVAIDHLLFYHSLVRLRDHSDKEV
jgi:hypothetical protein